MKSIILLLASITLLGVGGCKTKSHKGLEYETVSELKTSIHQTVDDQERVTQLLDVVNDFQKESDRTAQKIRSLRAKTIELSDDYATNRQDLEAVYDEINLEINNLCNLIRDSHFEFKALCSKKEWESITGDGMRLFNLKKES